MSTLYPLKFKPVFKDKIWGGQKIKTVLGQDFSPLPNCGEVWALSGVENNQTLIPWWFHRYHTFLLFRQEVSRYNVKRGPFVF